jgi:hypothetical protein
MNQELIADTLDNAADIIDERGWTQEPNGHGDHGEVCMVVAMGIATYHNDIFHECKGAVITNLDLPPCGCGCGAASIPTWNDTPGRTKEDVTNALHKIANIVREQVDD